jgi:hypothetical protein
MLKYGVCFDIERLSTIITSKPALIFAPFHGFLAVTPRTFDAKFPAQVFQIGSGGFLVGKSFEKVINAHGCVRAVFLGFLLYVAHIYL